MIGHTQHNSRHLPYPSFPPTPNTPYQPRTPPPEDRQGSAAWSPESDERLLQARQQGLNWQPIANQFPGKTANACRKRYERLIEKRNAADSWDGTKVGNLAKAYNEVREQMWSMLADRVGERWSVVESKCFEKGLKALMTQARNEIRQERRNAQLVTDEHDPHHSFMRNLHRERSHSRDSDPFRDHHRYGQDPSTSPYATGSRLCHEEDFPGPHSASAQTSSSSRFPTPNRTFSNSNSSFGGFTPITTTSPSFPISASSPSFPLTTSPTATVQPPLAVSQGHHPSQTLPSLRDLSVFPSLLDSTRRHSVTNHAGSMQAPVTTH